MPKNTAQQIADAVLVKTEGEDLLIEAMCRALCKVYDENEDPDDLDGDHGGRLWEQYKKMARAKLVCDRVLRGPGDEMMFKRLQARKEKVDE